MSRASVWLVLFGALIASSFSFAKEGSESGGGGDTATELRVSEIRGDLLKWLTRGGGKDLHLPKALTYREYVSSMTAVLIPHAVVIGAVTTKQEADTIDPEQKVIVAGVFKTCRGFISQKDGMPHILCNSERFRNTTESRQYQLIHHEYASLAGIEQNQGASSDYEISKQITSYLRPETVLRLAVKKANSFEARLPLANLGKATLTAKLAFLIPANDWGPCFENGKMVDCAPLSDRNTYCRLNVNPAYVGRVVHFGRKIQLSGKAEHPTLDFTDLLVEPDATFTRLSCFAGNYEVMIADAIKAFGNYLELDQAEPTEGIAAE